MSTRKPNDIDDERLEAWLARAPTPAASPTFRADVMARIEARARGGWRARLAAFLWGRRQLEWTMAGMATAVLALSVLGAVGLWQFSSPQGPRQHTVAMRDGGTVLVRFALDMPQARQVALAGDFTAWRARVPLKRKPDGTWVAEVPLRPGNYEYTFIVNGHEWVRDPHAQQYRPDGFGNTNAVLSVPSV